MVPSPEMILGTVRAGFECGAEVARFLQTEQGKDLIEQLLKDRARWDAFWADAERGARKLLSGELLKQD